LLREALQLDPTNEKAVGLLEQCAQRLADVAKEAYQYDLQSKAKEYMDLALTINPDESEWIELREKWGGS
jgi:hypothetical protein